MSLLQQFQQRTGINELMLKNYLTLRALEQQNILQALSIALAKSLNSFQQHPLPPAQTPLQNLAGRTAVEPCQKEGRRAVIEILSDGQQLSVGNQLKNNLKSQQCRAETRQIPQQKKEAKVEPKAQEINPTSAEYHPEESLRKKKTKQIKKRKEGKQATYSSGPLPTLDELQTCHLPDFGLQAAEVRARRQGLLRRSVQLWGSQLKKEKRELRMLL